MTLTVKDRLALLMALPREGSITTLRVLQALRMSLSFSEEELTRLKIEDTPTGCKWDASAQPIEVEISPKAHVIIQEALTRMDAEKRLTEDFLPVWGKFFPEKEA